MSRDGKCSPPSRSRRAHHRLKAQTTTVSRVNRGSRTARAVLRRILRRAILCRRCRRRVSILYSTTKWPRGLRPRSGFSPCWRGWTTSAVEVSGESSATSPRSCLFSALYYLFRGCSRVCSSVPRLLRQESSRAALSLAQPSLLFWF
eukprot:Amastigsp_a854715_9.p3 type:complete len:147 gc:universal Amastigsp_a854715_9:223-663(+)